MSFLRPEDSATSILKFHHTRYLPVILHLRPGLYRHRSVPGVSLALTGLAGGKKGSILEDMFAIIAKGALKGKSGPMAILICCVTLQDCASNHPLLKPESRQAAIQVAAPYIMSDCSAIEFYAGYRFNWANVDPEGDPDFKHGFGGIIGGCDKFAKVACMLQDDCSQASDCEKRVTCEVVKVLNVAESVFEMEEQSCYNAKNVPQESIKY